MEVVSLSSLPVGVLFWNSPEPCLTVLTKMTLALGPNGIELAQAQAPFHPAVGSMVDCPLELHHPGDFVPRKSRCDVLVTGRAYADAPSLVIGAHVRVGSLNKRFYALASERASAIPLSMAYLRSEPSSDAGQVTVGPLSPLHPLRARFAEVAIDDVLALRRMVLSTEFDFGFFNAAPDDQQIPSISPGMPIALHGLARDAAKLRGTLPTLWPRLYVPDERRGHGLREIPLVCDTLWIDTDRATCELTFRGTLVLGHPDRVPARLVVTLDEAFGTPDRSKIEARMVGAERHRAVTPEDLRDVVRDVLEIEPDAEAEADSEELEPEEVEPDEVELQAIDAPAQAVEVPAPVAPVAAPAAVRSLGMLGGMRLGRPRAEEPKLASEVERDDDDVTRLHMEVPAPRTTESDAAPRERPNRAMTVVTELPIEERPSRRPMTVVTELPIEERPSRRPPTMPFARAETSSPPPPHVAPPESGLPFLNPRRSQTIELSADKNPLLAGLPFAGGRRGEAQTMELGAGQLALLAQALPFPGAPSARSRAPDAPPETDRRTGLPFHGHTGATRLPLVPPSELAASTLIPLPPPPEHDASASSDRDSARAAFAALGATGSTGTAPEAPPPWAERGALRAETLQPLLHPIVDKVGLLPLATEAAIQLAIWDGAAPLREILAGHGLSELTWHEHRRRRDDEVRDEAAAGGNVKALAAHEAQEHAKRAREPSEPVLELAAYARVRAALADAADEAGLLAARGIDLDVWERDHRIYRKRLRTDEGLTERFRAALEAEKRALGQPEPPPAKKTRVAAKRRRSASREAKA